MYLSSELINGTFIVAGSDAGLANRLRVLIAYMYIAKVKFNNSNLVFIWDVNAACPGLFSDVFEPLDGIAFGTTQTRAMYAAKSLASFPDCRSTFGAIMMQFEIPKKGNYWYKIQKDYYRKLKPVVGIVANATKFIRTHNICNASAMHLRQTDMALVLGNRATGYEKMERFIKSRPSDEIIYFMTDNRQAQQHFMNRYGARIVVYKEIAVDETNSSQLHENRASSSLTQAKRPSEHRYTSIEHMVMDVIIASHAWKWLERSLMSSASELVPIYGETHENLC